MGILSCAGRNLIEAKKNFVEGICCLSPIADSRASSLRAKFAGQIPEFDTGNEFLEYDRHVQLALVAAREALAHASINPKVLGRRMGLIFSTCSGPMLLIEKHYTRVLAGHPEITEAELLAKRYYTGAHLLARALGIHGLCSTVVTACSASTAAIALAADLIRSGQLDVALAGGADAFSISTLAGFDGLRATSEGKCAPFSKPSGLNLGEAAAFVVLESAEASRQRGGSSLATVLGSGMSNDAHHCSAPEPGGRGLSAAMANALADAGITATQISYVNAHGTGTEANDKAECRALRKVFGDRIPSIPVSSTKSIVGHCLGAAGAIETIASIICAGENVLPPTANFTELREGCNIDCIPDAGRVWADPKIFLSNNSAFGGHNTSLALAVGVPGLSPPTSEDLSPGPIYITACGIVSAAGVGLEPLMASQSRNFQHVRPILLPGIPPLDAAQIDGAAVEMHDRRLDLRGMDRSSKWATLASRLAIREAKFPEKPADLAKLGLFLNLSAGPSWAESEYLTSFLSNNGQVTELAAFPYIVPSSVAGNVCRTLMLSGHNLTLNPGPAAGLHGLGPALAAMRCGHAEALLCGAVDELSERIFADSFYAGRVFPACPPGEGAAIFMLESAAHARKRGAKLIAEICSFDSAMNLQSAEEMNNLTLAALEKANVHPDTVKAVVFYGDSTQIPSAFQSKVLSFPPTAGFLEGAQPLIDLALTLNSSNVSSDGVILSLAISRGMATAVVFRKIQEHASHPLP